MQQANTPIKFDIYSGDQLVRSEILTGPNIKIGKIASTQLRLDDDSVSRMHASIDINSPDDVVLLDLGSASGTTVNGNKIMRHQLRSADVIMFGQVKVVVSIAGQTQLNMGQATAKPAKQKATKPAVSVDPMKYSDGSKALEVMVIWTGDDDQMEQTIMDVQHLYQPNSNYVIGWEKAVDLTSKSLAAFFRKNIRETNCLINPKYLPTGMRTFPLANFNGDSVSVNIPDALDGDVMLNDRDIYQISDLRSQNKLNNSSIPNAKVLSLPFKGRCRLRFGQMTLILHSVYNAKKLPPPPIKETVDPAFIGSLVGTTAVMVLIGLLISMIPPSPESLAQSDSLELASKFITIDLIPEEEKPKEPEKKEKQGSKGAQKAKGEEGQIGKKESTETDKRFQVKGIDTGDPSVVRGRKEAMAEAAASDIFSAVSDSGLLSGDSSAVALGALEGFQGNRYSAEVGDAFGAGGLGGVGTGMGGGGTSETGFGLGGLSTIGGGVGNGNGNRGYGSGAADVGERKAKKPKVIAMDAEIEKGSLPKDVIRRIIVSRAGAYQNCYERQLQAKKDLNGTIRVLLKISGSGSVLLAKVDDSDMNNPSVEQCVIKELQKLKFPAPENGGIVVVRYPFKFKAN
jgi:pSer/pThr/pTyr-binding forkhead associated (FHA) protein